MSIIDDTIEKFFPEAFKAAADFENWCEDIIESMQPSVANLLFALVQKLEKETRNALAWEGVQRDFWRLFGDKKPLKSVSSIRSKLARNLIAENIENSISERDLKERIYQLPDLGRVL